MSKKANISAISLTVLFLIIGACNTNKEVLKFQKQTEHILGEWNIHEFLINGIDSAEYFNKYPIAFINFLEEQNEVRFYFSGLDTVITKHLFGTWNIDTENSELDINYSISSFENETILNYHVFNRKTINKWEIKKFTKKELIMETDPNTNHYRLHLKKSKNPWYKKTTN